MIVDVLENTSLVRVYDEKLFYQFKEEMLNDLNNVPAQAGSEISFAINVNGTCYWCSIQRENNIYLPCYIDEPFDSYAIHVTNGQQETVISLYIDARQVDGFDVPIGECLYQSLLELIQYENPSFQYASEYIPLFWDLYDISAFNFLTLSENYISNKESFDYIYNQMIPLTPDGWDLIMIHYNSNTELFSDSYGHYNLMQFMQHILQDGTWTPPDNIWLWACDAGVPNNNGYIVAQEMSYLIGGTVKAANGRIITGRTKQYTPEKPEYEYFIVNVHNTKWDLDDYSNLSKMDYIKFKLFLLLHMCRTEEAEWNTFIGGEYVEK